MEGDVWLQMQTMVGRLLHKSLKEVGDLPYAEMLVWMVHIEKHGMNTGL